MYLNIIFLPLFGSLFSGLAGRYLGPVGTGLLSTLNVSISLIISCFVFYEVGYLNTPCTIKLLEWFNTELFLANWGFLFDSLTAVMLIVVTFISSLVHLYSTEYMSHDPHLPRFMSYLSLFTFFMLILVTADNFLQLFVGWEGVGLCSYLLINFWFTRIQANKAAIKAMIVNRIGDFGLALGIFTIFISFNTVEYSVVFGLVSEFQQDHISFLGCLIHLITLITILLFVGAVGKSAQLGLHTWLPDAMEGPTPVSALIHAATMVTAGVFLLARCSPLFEYAPFSLMIVTVLGSMTSFFAASTGLLQNDLKKVIAYSTCSQLGYMIFACGVSNYAVGIFHLSNHAFFKALLFLGAGSVIHAVADEQDMRRMGGLKRLVPFTFSVMLIGSLALMGFPFLTGFYSKDVILEVAFAGFSNFSQFAYFLGIIAAFFTAFYSMRLSYLTFLSNTNGFKPVIIGAHDSPIRMALPLFILVFPSLFIGYISKDFFIGLGNAFWNNALFVTPIHYNQIDSEFIPQFYKLLPLFLSLSGAFSALFLYLLMSKELYKTKISFLGVKLYTFLNRKWFFDKVYNEQINQKFLNFGYQISYKLIDRGLIEMLGPLGLMFVFRNSSKFISRQHTGLIYDYIFYLFMTFIFILLVFKIISIFLLYIILLSGVFYATSQISD